MNLVAAWRINLFIFFGSTHKNILIMWLENNAASSVSRKSSTAFGTTPPGDRITASRWRNGSTSYWISSPLSKNCSKNFLFLRLMFLPLFTKRSCSCCWKSCSSRGLSCGCRCREFLTSMELVKLGTPDAEGSPSLKTGFGQIIPFFSWLV